MEEFNVYLPGDAEVEGHFRLAHLYYGGQPLLKQAQHCIGNNAEAAELLQAPAIIGLDVGHPPPLSRPQLTEGQRLLLLPHHEAFS